MICPNCHGENPEGARFCVHCAYPLAVDPNATPPAPGVPAPGATPTTPPSPAAGTYPPYPSYPTYPGYGAPPSQPLQPYASAPSQPWPGYGSPPAQPYAPPSQPLPGPYSTPLSQPYPGYPAPGYPAPMSQPLSQPLSQPFSQPLVAAPPIQTPSPGVEIFGPDAHPAAARPYTRLQAFLLRNLSARVAVSTWFMAAIGAAVAVVVGLVLTAIVQAFLSKAISDAVNAAAASSPSASFLSGGVAGILTPDLLKLFALEHRIPLDVGVQVTSQSVQAGGGMTLNLPITALLLIPALALILGGYVAASSDYSRNPRYSIARGALIGPFYAILVTILAFFGSSSVSGGALGVSGSVTVAPSAFLAFVYGLIWGCLFGAVGGWIQLFGRYSLAGVLPSLQRFQRRNIAGAITGSVVALVTGILLFMALEVGAVLLLNTSAASSITSSGTAVSGVPLGSSLAVGLIAVFAPTLALYLFSFAAGGSLGTYATASIGNANQSNNISLLGSHTTLPGWIYLILLVPAVAYFVGGWTSARASGARDSGAGLAAGALMALPLSVLVALGAYVASASIDLSLLGETASEGVSPSVGATFLAVLIGGAILGGLGGAAAVAMPSLGRLPRALLFPIRPFGFALFPLFDRISGKPRGMPRSPARLWLYDSVLAGVILAVLVLALDVAGVPLADVLSWNVIVTLFAVLSGLLVAVPLLLIAGALVAGLLNPPIAGYPAQMPAYAVVPAGAPPALAAPGMPYGGPYSSPYSSPYSTPYSTPLSMPLTSPPAGAPTIPPGAQPSDAAMPDDAGASNMGRGQLPPSAD